MRSLCLFAALVLTFSFTGCTRQSKVRRALAQARAYQDSAEFEKAKITYLSALRLDPQNVEAIKQIGYIWSEQGSALQAARFLTKAQELAPQDLAVREKLALSLAALPNPAEARKVAKGILQQEPQQPDALATLAQTVSSPAETSELEARLQKLDGSKVGVLLARALLAIHRQDAPAAEAAANRALGVDPKSDVAYSLRGAALLTKKDFAGAEQAFKSASELAPRSDASLAYARVLLQKDPAAAKNYLAQLSAKIPDYLPVWILQARIAATDKQPDQALAALDHVFPVDPSNYEARLLQGQLLLAKGEADKAATVLDKLNGNALYAQNAAPKLELARAYLLKGNPTQAAALLSESIKLQPNFADAVLLLAQVKLQAGDARQAVETLNAFLKDQPNSPAARLLLAQAYRSSGDLDDAARVLTEQPKAAPDAVEPRLLLGSIRLQQNKRPEARALFEEAARIAPKNPGAVAALVDLDLADKNFDGALRRAEAFTREAPAAPGAFVLLARVYLAQEQWGKAEESLKKSIALDANDRSAYDLLVTAYLKTNRYEQAGEEIDAFLVRNPADARALATAGVIEEKLQQWDKARGTYEKLLAADPNSVPALNNLATLDLERFNQLDKAYELASRAHTLRPDDVSVSDTLGWIAYRRKDYPQAVTLLRETAGKLPDNPEVQYHYGMACYMTGQAPAARTALGKAAAAAADFPGKSEIPHALAMLEGAATADKSITDEELAAVLKQQPGDLVARQRLAGRFEQEGAFAKEAALWEEALTLDPKAPAALLKLANLYAGPLHDPAKAYDYAKRARASAPDDPEAVKLTGRTAYQTGNFAVAYGLLQEAVRSPDAGADLLRDYALTAYNLGKVEEARQVMRHAVEAAPNAPETRKAKMFLDFTATESQPQTLVSKEGEVLAALKEDAQSVPALMLQAALEVQRQQIASAAVVYRGILARLPDFGPAQKRLAAIELEQPDQRSAGYELAVRARRNLPDDPEVAQVLAVARYQRKEYESVVQLLQESAGRRPLDARLLFYLGMSQLQQKQQPAGYQALEQALAAGLSGSDAEEAKHNLSTRPSS